MVVDGVESGGAVTLPHLMLVTDRRRTRGRELVTLVAQAAQGGVRLVQVRDLVGRIRLAVPPSTVILVNGSRRAARTLHAGLHLPAAASPIGEAEDERAAYPLYGRSVHDDAEARRAVEDQADYIVLGTIYPTPSKPGHPGRGAGLVRRIRRLVEPVPVFAIGGVTVARIPELVHAGAHGVAVCGALLGANHPRRVAQAMRLALEVAERADAAEPGRPRPPDSS
jgi:thiamine-phosphate pyrophosphorylase